MVNKMLLEELITRYPALIPVKDEIYKATERLIDCYQHGMKVLVCGNGGSSSDSDHIVGELMKGFEDKRPVEESLKKQLAAIGGERGKFLSENLQQGLPAISLSAHSALITAIANDNNPDLIFAQQVAGYGSAGDVLIALSCSGNSQNIMDAIITAKAKGMLVIAFTGITGGKMRPYCDILINVPEQRTSFVQELHLPVYHTICLMVEEALFEKEDQ